MIDGLDEFLSLDHIETFELIETVEAFDELVEIVPGNLIDSTSLLSIHSIDQRVNHYLLIKILIVGIHSDN